MKYLDHKLIKQAQDPYEENQKTYERNQRAKQMERYFMFMDKKTEQC